MPLYDYRCDACATEFEARRAVEARDEAPCPKCGGIRVTRAMPLVVTYVKSGRQAQPAPEGCCGGFAEGAACACAARA